MIALGAEPRAEGFCQRMGMVSQGKFDHDGQRLIWRKAKSARS